MTEAMAEMKASNTGLFSLNSKKKKFQLLSFKVKQMIKALIVGSTQLMRTSMTGFGQARSEVETELSRCHTLSGVGKTI